MTATLRSNSGEAEFVIEILASAPGPGFEVTIQLRGVHSDGDHEQPHSIIMERLWLGAKYLTALRDHIAQWSSQPLDRLTVESLNGDFELAHLPGQSIQVRFQPRPDTISDLHPVVSILFSAGALNGEFHFVTDQSCLGIFCEQLTAELIKA